MAPTCSILHTRALSLRSNQLRRQPRLCRCALVSLCDLSHRTADSGVLCLLEQTLTRQAATLVRLETFGAVSRRSEMS